MRSLSLKSLMVLIAGSRLLSKTGCEVSAEMPRTSCGVPLVRDHSTSRPGTPPEPTSRLPEISASLTAVGSVEGEPRSLHVIEGPLPWHASR